MLNSKKVEMSGKAKYLLGFLFLERFNIQASLSGFMIDSIATMSEGC